MGSLSLLQGIFPTQVSCIADGFFTEAKRKLRQKGSPRRLEWITHPFSRGSAQPRNLTGVSCISGRFFTNQATREAHINMYLFFFKLFSQLGCYRILCDTVGPCLLPTVYIAVRTHQSQTPQLFLLPILPSITISLFSKSVSLFLLYK